MVGQDEMDALSDYCNTASVFCITEELLCKQKLP